MAVGEHVSVRANQELLQRELDIERSEIEHDPTGETRELAGIYVEQGLDRATAMSVASKMMEDPETALEAHAKKSSDWILRARISRARRGVVLRCVLSGRGHPVAAMVLRRWHRGSGHRPRARRGGRAGPRRGRLLTCRSRWRSALRQAGLLLFAFVVTNLVGRLGAAV